MRRHEIVDAKFAAIAALSKRARVAFGCCMVEHTCDLYRLGPVTYRAADLPDGALAVDPDTDLLELSLERAWRFVADGCYEPAEITTLIGSLKAALKARPKEPELMLPGVGPVNGTIDTLTAITDDGPSPIKSATSRTILGVMRLVMLGLGDNDQVPDKEEDEESAWQLRVAQRLVARGDEPISRSVVEDLLAERLTWRTRLESYVAQCRAVRAK